MSGEEGRGKTFPHFTVFAGTGISESPAQRRPAEMPDEEYFALQERRRAEQAAREAQQKRLYGRYFETIAPAIEALSDGGQTRDIHLFAPRDADTRFPWGEKETVSVKHIAITCKTALNDKTFERRLRSTLWPRPLAPQPERPPSPSPRSFARTEWRGEYVQLLASQPNAPEERHATFIADMDELARQVTAIVLAHREPLMLSARADNFQNIYSVWIEDWPKHTRIEGKSDPQVHWDRHFASDRGPATVFMQGPLALYDEGFSENKAQYTLALHVSGRIRRTAMVAVLKEIDPLFAAIVAKTTPAPVGVAWWRKLLFK